MKKITALMLFGVMFFTAIAGQAPTAVVNPVPETQEPAAAPAANRELTAADLEAFLDGIAPMQISQNDIAGITISVVKDGTLPMELPAEPERHHTSSSAVLPWIKVIGGARMVGDAALIDAAIDASARQCATARSTSP